MNRYFHAIIACLCVQANVHGATIEQIATDHNNLNADVAGGATIASPTTVGSTPIPEPDAAKIISMIGVFILLAKRHRSRF
jgi:hypothetical protein